MKTLLLTKPILFIAVGSMLATGCVTREKVVYRDYPPPSSSEEVVVTDEPPPVIYETQTIAPGPGFVWIGGAWVWRGHWVWVHGRWAHPPHPGAVWVPHRYGYHNGVHVFIHGYWQY